MSANNSKTIQIIRELHKMTPANAKVTRSRFEEICNKISMALLASAIVMTGVTFAMIGWHSVHPFTEEEKRVGLWLAAITCVLPILAGAVDFISNLVIFLQFRTDFLRRFLREIEHDQKHIDSLARHSRKSLNQANELIQLKATRIRNRLGVFVGGSDKIALVSIVGIGWGAFKELSAKNQVIFPNGLPDAVASPEGALTLGFACFTGFAIGVVIQNFRVQRYAYQSELIGMALSQQANCKLAPWKFQLNAVKQASTSPVKQIKSLNAILTFLRFRLDSIGKIPLSLVDSENVANPDIDTEPIPFWKTKKGWLQLFAGLAFLLPPELFLISWTHKHDVFRYFWLLAALLSLISTLILSIEKYNTLCGASDERRKKIIPTQKYHAELCGLLALIAFLAPFYKTGIDLDRVNSSGRFQQWMVFRSDFFEMERTDKCQNGNQNGERCIVIANVINQTHLLIEMTDEHAMAELIGDAERDLLRIRTPQSSKVLDSAVGHLRQLRIDSSSYIVLLIITQAAALVISSLAISRKLSIAAFEAHNRPDVPFSFWRYISKRLAVWRRKSNI